MVGDQPFGGARASGTDDKVGSSYNLLRWTSLRTIKELLLPPGISPILFSRASKHHRSQTWDPLRSAAHAQEGPPAARTGGPFLLASSLPRNVSEETPALHTVSSPRIETRNAAPRSKAFPRFSVKAERMPSARIRPWTEIDLLPTLRNAFSCMICTAIHKRAIPISPTRPLPLFLPLPAMRMERGDRRAREKRLSSYFLRNPR